MSTITITNTLPVELWQAFVDEHADGTIFHTPAMVSVFQHARNHHPEVWAALQNDRPLALFLPVFVSILPFPLNYFTTRAIAYSPLLYHNSEAGYTAAQMVLTAYTRHVGKRAIFTEIRGISQQDTKLQSLLADQKYNYFDYDNFLVDLNLPVDRVWNNISKSARKHIKHALERNKLAIEVLPNINQLPVWYKTLKKTYLHAGIPLADISMFKAAFELLVPQNMAQFWLGMVDDVPVAASISLFYKRTIYGWYRGFNRDYAAYLPNDVMVWRLLEWGATNGYHTFDFGGAGRSNQEYGPRQFKAKFGGIMIPCGRNTHIHSTFMFKSGVIGYNLVHKFLR